MRPRLSRWQQYLLHCHHPQAIDLYLETRKAVDAAEASLGCRDWDDKCGEWVKSGECSNNPDFMAVSAGLVAALGGGAMAWVSDATS
jgi:hypothetical protein